MNQVQVLGGDLALGGHAVAQPLDQATPVLRSHQHDREVFDLAGLDEGEGFEHLIQGAEPAREDYEGGRVLHEHRLPDEEVPEVDGALHVRVDVLLEGQLDVAADGETVPLLRPAIRCLHDSGATPGDHREALLGEQLGGRDRLLVDRVVRLRASRPEDGDGVADIVQGVEPFDELPHDPEHPPRVRMGEGPPLIGGGRREKPFVFSGRLGRAARLLRHGLPERCRRKVRGGRGRAWHRR